MKRVFGILLLVCVVLVGCNNPNNESNTSTGKQPGKFSASVLSDTMGGNARGISLGSYTISNSKSIYFILRNVGDFAITDITLTAVKLNKGGTFEPITVNGIIVSPSAIAVLEKSGNTSVERVIEVDINHGNVIGLISQQYIQKADFKGATIRITGKTTNEKGVALDVSLDVDIETVIKVASFEVVYSQDNGVTYKKAEYGEQVGGRGSTGFLIPDVRNEPDVLLDEAYIKIHNTGTVPIKYHFLEKWTTLAAGDYSERLISNFDGLPSVFFFNIDTQGIVFDNDGTDLKFFPDTTIVQPGNLSGSLNSIWILWANGY